MLTGLRSGHTATIYLACEDGYADSSSMLELVCREQGGDGDSWTPSLGFVIAPAPPPVSPPWVWRG
ncbi:MULTISPECIES: hypothetical protein [unclassified Crossiella]|uniref:hypothetical protein n=1 Tax=unclassified Crossiella TaxID=2620835 RepID=UPI002000274E|nr:MULTISPECIES: hypothetical protein [unclassified Crossiella]MCK2240937.1 hypothetical protein [Crossiella sp. S99.2]MCK2253919.1 hypothetical protein [Crossiella sp. S99.1]